MTNMMKKVVGLVVALAVLMMPLTAFAEDNYDFGATINIGTADYALSTAFPYTVLTFEPTEDGVYTFNAADGVMGIVSYNGMWVTIEPSTETVAETTIEWECTGVGQSIWLAVAGEGDTITVETTRRNRVVEPEFPWTYYENTVTPETFTFDGDADAMMFVETFDDIVDEAILGDDGYYHLNTVDGPVLYVNLTDKLMSVADAISYGQMKAVLTDENGNVYFKTEYNDAATAYVQCADANTGFYPLTADLIEMYQMVGKAQGWFGENGFIGGDFADAWMFACYYDEAELDSGATTPDEDEKDDSETPTTTEPVGETTTTESAGATVTTTTTLNGETTTTSSTRAPEKSPQTGDSTDTLVFFAVAMLALGVMTTSVVAKKTNG